MPVWTARIGILSPSVFEIPSDWSLILPSGFSLVATGLNVRAHTPEEFQKATAALESTLSVFTAEETDAILLGGITLATQRGYRAEQEILSALSRRMELPITSGMNATAEALRYLKVKKVVIATAYKETINRAVRRYYEDNGLEVIAIKGHDVSKPVDQVKLPAGTSATIGRELFQRHPEAEAVLLQGRWPSVAHVEALEVETGIPVVATVAASLWWVLRTLNIRKPMDGYGRLLRD